ncbi:MAG: glutamate transport system permease protein [Miltoncostaeaceae bacterium]|nr:glutamate transport system permease protein [Miltoncostaeaceae bacterium]
MDLILDNLDLFGEGLWTTVQLTVLAYLLAFAIGLAIATLRVSPVGPLRAAGVTYVELVRNTPLLVLLILAFFGLPKLGLVWSPFTTAVIILSVYTGAFIGETIRAGVNTVAAGQVDAARAIGLTFTQTMSLVVLPQAVRSVVPPLGNLFIALTKNTSLAYAISVVELTGTAERLATDTARALPAFGGACVAYLILTLPAGLFFGRLERKVLVRR